MVSEVFAGFVVAYPGEPGGCERVIAGRLGSFRVGVFETARQFLRVIIAI
jgi:hypothetical protein